MPALTLRIERLSLGGEGVARHEGLAVFVPYTAPGDTVEARIVDRRDRFARAELIRVIQPGPGRVAPPCPYHFGFRMENAIRDPKSACGGCSWQHLAYERQLAIKRELVAETLQRIGGLKGIVVQPVLGMNEPWRYRNKVQQPVGWDGRRLITGFFAARTHELLDIEDCLIQPELSVRILRRARDLLEKYGLRGYDEERHAGWIRHLLVRVAAGPRAASANQATARALLVFVSRSPDFPHEREIVATLSREFPSLAGIHQNVQPARSNVILGRQWRRLAGENAIEERLGRFSFRLSAGSFFQVNTEQTEVLYDTARRFAGRGKRLLDLYTGVGTIAMWLADQFEEVGGVEENPAAIRDAEANAERNGIANARFVAAPVERFLQGLPAGSGGGLTVVLDPPRAGCGPAVVSALLRLRPARIVYVSCDPATLARDLKGLVTGGYRIGEVQPVDLFPQTPHIETVVGLTDRR